MGWIGERRGVGRRCLLPCFLRGADYSLSVEFEIWSVIVRFQKFERRGEECAEGKGRGIYGWLMREAKVIHRQVSGVLNEEAED